MVRKIVFVLCAAFLFASCTGKMATIERPEISFLEIRDTSYKPIEYENNIGILYKGKEYYWTVYCDADYNTDSEISNDICFFVLELKSATQTQTQSFGELAFGAPRSASFSHSFIPEIDGECILLVYAVDARERKSKSLSKTVKVK